MNGIGPELPLNRDHRFGLYSLVMSYKEEVKQNFKNLLLTSPGERVMNPDFGVGLRRFLFDPREHSIPAIRQRINSQVRKYMPFIRINKISFGPQSTSSEESHTLSIFIEYDAPSINLSTSITLQTEDIN
jgi:phage baseplate assembly protein W